MQIKWAESDIITRNLNCDIYDLLDDRENYIIRLEYSRKEVNDPIYNFIRKILFLKPKKWEYWRTTVYARKLTPIANSVSRVK